MRDFLYSGSGSNGGACNRKHTSRDNGSGCAGSSKRPVEGQGDSPNCPLQVVPDDVV